MPLSAGDVLEGRYRVVRAVQSGGMGAVYEARDQRLDGSPCALKEMRGEFAGGENSGTVKRKFAEEVQVLSRCVHPAIPRVRDSFMVGEIRYIVMDFIPGQNLEEELRDYLAFTGMPFPPERLVSDALQVLDVLKYIHGLSPPILHRDIKPANLIRQRHDGRIRMVDFGLARPLTGSAATHTLVGTLAYCSAEQLQGRADRRSDLYSLGATMYHLLTGVPPVPLSGESVRDVLPTANAALAAVIDRARAVRPEDRFQDATEMKTTLAAWSGLAPPPLVPAPPRAAPTVHFVELEETPGPAPSYSRLGALWLAILVAVLLLAGLGLGLGRGREPATEPQAAASPAAETAVAMATPRARRQKPASSPENRAVSHTPEPASGAARPAPAKPSPAPTRASSRVARKSPLPIKAYPASRRRATPRPQQEAAVPEATPQAAEPPPREEPQPAPGEDRVDLLGLVVPLPEDWERMRYVTGAQRAEMHARAHHPEREASLLVQLPPSSPPAPDADRDEEIRKADADGWMLEREDAAPGRLVLWFRRNNSREGLAIRLSAVVPAAGGRGPRVLHASYTSSGDRASAQLEAEKLFYEIMTAVGRL